MARTETVEFTNMCMICDGSRVVVIDRKKRDWPDITFPGGHIEPGESFTDAVIREVQEETGLHIRSPQLCGIKDWCENQCRLLCCFITMNSNKEHWILCPACGSKTRARLLPDTVSVGSFNSVLKNSGYILMSSSSEAHTKCSLLLSSIKLSLIGAKASGTFI